MVSFAGSSRRNNRNNDYYHGYYYPQRISYYNDDFYDDQNYDDFSDDTVYEYEYIVEEISGALPSTQQFNNRLGLLSGFSEAPTTSSIGNGHRRQIGPISRQFPVNPAQLLFFSFGMVFGKALFGILMT